MKCDIIIIIELEWCNMYCLYTVMYKQNATYGISLLGSQIMYI